MLLHGEFLGRDENFRIDEIAGNIHVLEPPHHMCETITNTIVMHNLIGYKRRNLNSCCEKINCGG